MSLKTIQNNANVLHNTTNLIMMSVDTKYNQTLLIRTTDNKISHEHRKIAKDIAHLTVYTALYWNQDLTHKLLWHLFEELYVVCNSIGKYHKPVSVSNTNLLSYKTNQLCEMNPSNPILCFTCRNIKYVYSEGKWSSKYSWSKFERNISQSYSLSNLCQTLFGLFIFFFIWNWGYLLSTKDKHSFVKFKQWLQFDIQD